MSRNNNRGRGEARESASRTNGTIRCAIYTRKSTDEGLEQEFNNLDARMRRIEERHGISPDAAEMFAGLMARIEREEIEAGRINRELMDAGYLHEDLSAAALAAQAGRTQL
jgi:hypothetical protein